MPPGVILVEDSPYESALAYLALSRATDSVLQASDLCSAARLAHRARLAILGPRAVTRVSDQQVRALGIPTFGIGMHLSAADKRRALAAGLRAIYVRPRRWRDYVALFEQIHDGVQA